MHTVISRYPFWHGLISCKSIEHCQLINHNWVFRPLPLEGGEGWEWKYCIWPFPQSILHSDQINDNIRLLFFLPLPLEELFSLLVCGFMSWQHLRLHQGRYRLVTMFTCGDFIGRPNWKNALLAQYPYIPLSHIFLILRKAPVMWYAGIKAISRKTKVEIKSRYWCICWVLAEQKQVSAKI